MVAYGKCKCSMTPPAAYTYQRDVRIPRQAGRSDQAGPDERVVCHLTVSRPMRDGQTEGAVCRRLLRRIPDVTDGRLGATSEAAEREAVVTAVSGTRGNT